MLQLYTTPASAATATYCIRSPLTIPTIMTADVRRRCRGSDRYRLRTTAASAVVIVAAVIAAVSVAAARATTFEGGETATEPADDTVYMTQEVAAWNATAAAAGDYEYDDYDSTTADALQMPSGRYSPKPETTVAPRVDASTVVPAATITVQVPAATVTEEPVTNTTAATTTTAAITAADAKAVYSTTTSVVRPSTSVTTVVTATDATTFPTATTESGALMKIASPLGYGVTNVTTVATTPPPTTPNSSAPLVQCWRWTAALLLSLALVTTVVS